MLLPMRSLTLPGDRRDPLWVSPTVRWSSVGVALALMVASVVASAWRQLSGEVAGAFARGHRDPVADCYPGPNDRSAA